MSDVLKLDELSPGELESCLDEQRALVLPLGTIEWHSHHLPLGLDGIKAGNLGAAVAERSGAVLAPTSWWAAGGVPFPYTLRLSGDLIEKLLREVLVQFASMGFRTLVVLNGHYGLENSISVRRAAVDCMRGTASTVLPIAEYEVLLDLGATGDHAGVWETSLLWAARPDLVRLDRTDVDGELPGIVGEDPRGRATRELGLQGTNEVAEKVSMAIERALNQSALDRERFIGALEASLRALGALHSLRETRSRSEVPPVVTFAWIEHLRAVHSGRYEDATRHANMKFSRPGD